MSNKDLHSDPKPFKETENAWWYEEDQGLEVHVDLLRVDGQHLSLRIPWGMVRRAVQRKDQ